MSDLLESRSRAQTPGISFVTKRGKLKKIKGQRLKIQARKTWASNKQNQTCLQNQGKGWRTIQVAVIAQMHVPSCLLTRTRSKVIMIFRIRSVPTKLVEKTNHRRFQATNIQKKKKTVITPIPPKAHGTLVRTRKTLVSPHLVFYLITSSSISPNRNSFSESKQFH